MFVKLTKKDGSPVWINASYIVTVEPARHSGAVVVPIGDGLDYEVREFPEQVLRMIANAPAPAIVPVPPPKGLAPSRPEDLSGDESTGAEPVENSPQAKAIALAAPGEQQPSDAVSPVEPSVEPEPEAPKKKRTVRKTKKADGEPEEAPKKTTKSRTRKAKVVKPDFPSEQVEKLRRMAPGSVHKLRNTLKSQFRQEDPEPVIQMLVDDKIIALDQDHVMWTQA